MSKQEIREEMKELEGNPQIKAKIRRLQRDRARKQMMKQVPLATAVITNPTHFAVAIRYQLDNMGAPMVVARARTTWRCASAESDRKPRCRSSRIRRWHRRYTNLSMWGRKFRRICIARWPEILAYIFQIDERETPGMSVHSDPCKALPAPAARRGSALRSETGRARVPLAMLRSWSR